MAPVALPGKGHVNVTELCFPDSKTNTDLWPIVVGSGCEVHHRAQFFFLLLDFLHEVTRQRAFLQKKVLITTMRGNNVEQQALNTGVL